MKCCISDSGMITYAYSKEGLEMTNSKWQYSVNMVAFDSISEFVDSNGNRWKVGAEFKSVRGRICIIGMSIWSPKGSTPLTRRVVRDIQIESLFESQIAVETKNLMRTLRRYKSKSAHQGRAHSEDELKVVAEIYQSAVRAHEPVQATVAKTLGVSVSTAAKRIMVARSRGYIPALNGRERNVKFN
jgi:hypothetical protein